jgi:hypothetical protein
MITNHSQALKGTEPAQEQHRKQNDDLMVRLCPGASGCALDASGMCARSSSSASSANLSPPWWDARGLSPGES